jgi:hypothetical protein
MNYRNVWVGMLVCALASPSFVSAQVASASPETPVTAPQTPANASEPAPPAPPAPPAAPSATQSTAVESNDKVCRTVETLGSRLKKRKICRTAEQWRLVEANSRREVEAVQNRGGSGKDAKMGGG